MKINILGTVYKIKVKTPENDEILAKYSWDGYCDSISKEIVIMDFDKNTDFKRYNKKTKEDYYKRTLRHELIHAFLNESGLDASSLDYDGAWSKNEEMVDFFAIQFPKIVKTFTKLNIL